jgi:signal transduction histidine kinase
MASHFYILFYLQIALVAVHFSPATGFMTAAGASVLYWLASIPYPLDFEWHHLGARIVTFFLLSGALGYLSQRERQARAEAERLNQELRESQARLQVAYEALQAAQDKLVQAERLATIGQMAAKISHEVRNPLGAISLNTELLEDELLVLPEERRAEAATLVGAIKSQLDILSAVTEEYLRFARLPRPRLEPTLLPPVIEDLVNLVKGEFLARGVNISTNIASGLPALRLDPGQIRQVLLNLLRNAAEAMPDGGTARITAALRNNSSAQLADSSLSIADSTIRPINKSDFIEIAVEDTGVGIAPENLEKIFDPFFTTKEGGTGLGLAIARQIISDHGGTLTCESVPRQGTAFRLTLPIPEGEKIP